MLELVLVVLVLRLAALPFFLGWLVELEIKCKHLC